MGLDLVLPSNFRGIPSIASAVQWPVIAVHSLTAVAWDSRPHAM